MLTYISNSAHYKEVLSRVQSVKHMLWIGTADIKDLYVEIGKEKKPFLALIAQSELGVWVGPGRGSAAGSLVCYCLGITKIDPLKHDLLFERFLNPEGTMFPDIDIDFDWEGRESVLEWLHLNIGQFKPFQHVGWQQAFGKYFVLWIHCDISFLIRTKKITVLVYAHTWLCR